MNDKVTCHECGSQKVHERVAPITHKVGTRTVVIENDRHMYCPECNTISYRGSQLNESQRAIAAQIRREDGLLTPEDLRRIRLKYHFTQAEMEQMLTTGPKTWIRWERGKVVQSRAADQMIRQMARNPDVVRNLMRSANVQNEDAERELDQIDRHVAEKVLEKLRHQVTDAPEDLLERVVRAAARELRAARSDASTLDDERDAA